MNAMLKSVTLVLIPCLVMCAGPGTALAQDGTDLDPVVPTSSSSSSDDTAQAILVGLLITIVAVVFILGFKSDFGGSKRAKAADRYVMDR